MDADKDIRGQVTDWFTSADTCFLLGAGCSKCAGKPLIQELTEQVLQKADAKLKEQFENLKLRDDRPRTIEDLMNYLEQYREVLSSIKDAKGHNIKIEDINEWLQHIKKKIVEQIGVCWKESSHHEKFLQRLCESGSKRARDIFCLNYDTVLEASLDHIRVPYSDGFRGAVRGWFDAGVFNENEKEERFRIYKLHGSVSWVEDGEHVRRRGSNADSEPVVVYPSRYKHAQTQYGVYERLMENFRGRLRSPATNNRLIALGYSFNDDHINRAIFDAIRTPENNLTVIAFVGGDENNLDKQQQYLHSLVQNSEEHFNVFLGGGSKGKGAYSGNILDNAEGNAVCKLGLWEFEQLVDYLS